MGNPIMTRQQLIDSLRSSTCPNCTRRKKPLMSFCGTCFYTLPMNLRNGIHKKFTMGYEEAMEDSLQFLRSPQPQPVAPITESAEERMRRLYPAKHTPSLFGSEGSR